MPGVDFIFGCMKTNKADCSFNVRNAIHNRVHGSAAVHDQKYRVSSLQEHLGIRDIICYPVVLRVPSATDQAEYRFSIGGFWRNHDQGHRQSILSSIDQFFLPVPVRGLAKTAYEKKIKKTQCADRLHVFDY